MNRILVAAALLLSAPLHAEMVLVSNPGASLASLSQSQVSRLFLGQTDLLPTGSKAVVIGVKGDAQDRFAREILKKTPEQVEKYWARMVFTGKAKPPREVGATEVRSLVAATPGALSYMDRSQADGSVRIVAVTSD